MFLWRLEGLNVSPYVYIYKVDGANPKQADTKERIRLVVVVPAAEAAVVKMKFLVVCVFSIAILACSAEEEVEEKKTAKRGIYGLGYGLGYGYGHYPYYSYHHYPVVSKVYTSGHYTGLGHYGGYYGGLGHGYYGGFGYPYSFGHHGLYGHGYGYGWW